MVVSQGILENKEVWNRAYDRVQGPSGRTRADAIEAGLGAGKQVRVVAALAQLHDQHLQLLPRVVLLVLLQAGAAQGSQKKSVSWSKLSAHIIGSIIPSTPLTSLTQ